MGVLAEEIKPAMQGVIPSHVVTCARDGTPNATAISQVYSVDADHVALSHQFFNKTVRNVRENPRAAVWLISPVTFDSWDLEVEFERSETSGPIFEAMDMQIEAIASMVAMDCSSAAVGPALSRSAPSNVSITASCNGVSNWSPAKMSRCHATRA